MKRLLTLITLLLLTTSLLAGCNTARGFGQDVNELGTIISHAAS
ncbi:TPA: Entericidin A [Citrobacter freundii]